MSYLIYWHVSKLWLFLVKIRKYDIFVYFCKWGALILQCYFYPVLLFLYFCRSNNHEDIKRRRWCVYGKYLLGSYFLLDYEGNSLIWKSDNVKGIYLLGKQIMRKLGLKMFMSTIYLCKLSFIGLLGLQIYFMHWRWR